MNLSKRLEAIANQVPTGEALADIGTDHGYIPVYLVQNKRIPRAIAMDIHHGPLRKAQENTQKYQCADKIELRLSNGLEKLRPNEVQTVLIAGMGGHLICSILDEGKSILETIRTLIVSPHSEYPLVRKQLHKLGFKIMNECFLLDDKYYLIIKAVRGHEKYINETDYLFGRKLLDSKDQVLYEYLVNQSNVLSALVDSMQTQESARIKTRVAEIKNDIEQIRRVLEEYEL